MIINLDNYEQWLTLYVDNELSANDRIAVESFLREYPYLREELELLEQTKLSPDLISFSAKSTLLKPMLSEETEAKMLLHLDKELDRSQVAQFEKEIASDKFLAKEWQSLLKTKLDANAIIEYPYKKELYRKDESRVIRMPFLRWAAAAVVIGLGFYLGSTMLNANKPEGTNDIANNNNGSSKNNPVTTADTKTENVNGAQKENSAVTNETVAPLDQQQYATNDDAENKKQDQQGKNNLKKEEVDLKQQQKEIAAVNQPKKNNSQENEKVVNQPLNKYEQPGLQSNEIAALEPQKLNNTIELNKVNETQVKRPIIDENIRPSGSGYAQTASLNFDENDNSVFLMEEDNISRSKAGILLKKIKRNVERRANLKPGKSIRIAGFEFAAK